MFEKLKQVLSEGSPEQPQELTFRVEDAHKHADQLLKMAVPMKKWDMTNEELGKKYTLKKIYRYYFEPKNAKLVPEKDKIKVMLNGMHIGYVPSKDCTEVKKMLLHKVDISANIGGGEYKVVSLNGDAVVSEEYYYVKITIKR